eukprot:2073839-Rhodomonas_salina.3
MSVGVCRRLRASGLAATGALVLIAIAAVVFVAVQHRAEPVDLSSAPPAADFFSSALSGLQRSRCDERQIQICSQGFWQRDQWER